jgi:uncharacterized protein with PQ loop repeat
MGTEEKQLTEKESLDLIAMMINKAKNAYYETGVSAIMWGAVITFCALEKLAELQFGYRLPFDIYLLTFVAIIPQVFISIKEKKERKVKSYDDVYMDYVWTAFGICIFLMIFIVNVMFNAWEPLADEYQKLAAQPARHSFSEFVSSLFLLLYGLPTFITGAACKFKPMLWGGIFCWACCIAALFTPIKVDLLLTAASAIMAWLIPGIIIEKEYRHYKKEQAVANV